MAAPVNYYWGDVVTTGNTTMQQSLTVLGQPYFGANIQSAVNGGPSIGSAAVPFANAFFTRANAAMNVVTMSAVIGINVASATANLQVQGNVFVSNAVSLTNVSATLGSNIGGSLTASGTATIRTLAGIGTTAVTGGAILNLVGNVYASNAVQTTNIFTQTANLTGIGNVQRVFTTQVGISTAAAGSTLSILGNVWASNALSTTNVYASNVNTTTTNTLSIYSPTGFVGVGTATPSGTALYVAGNLYASNALVTTNIQAGTMNTTTMNTLSISGGAIVNSVSVPVQNSILGTTSESLGYSVGTNSDGTIVAVGKNASTINIYRFTNSWDSGTPFSTSGLSRYMAMSGDGNSILVGSTTWYMYKYSGSTWSLTKTFTFAGSQAESWGINYDGTVVILGDQTLGVSNVYRYTGSWDNGTALVNPGGAGLYGQGSAISGDGLTAIVGAYTSNSSAGAAYSFKYSGGSWGAGVYLGAPTASSAYGYTCALNYDGTVAAISYTSTSRKLDILRYSGGVWTVQTTVTPNPSGFASTCIWSSISMSNDGNSILLGAPAGGPPGNSGEATLITYNGSSWSSGTSLAGATTNSQFGNRVALSRNGALAVVGAYVYNTNMGAAYIIPVAGVGSGGSTLTVSGNVAASNALATTNLSMTNANVTTLNTFAVYGQSGSVGINTSAPSGTALNVLGNLYASNALVTTNLSMTTGNVATLNVLSVSGLVGVNTSAPSGTALNVLGNLYASNALVTTNISANTVNTTTMNTLSISGGAIVNSVSVPSANTVLVASATQFGYGVSTNSDGTIVAVGRFGGSYANIYRFTNNSWDSGTPLLVAASAARLVRLSSDGNSLLCGGASSSNYLYKYAAGVWTLSQTFVFAASAAESASISDDGNVVLLGDSTTGTANVYRYSGSSWDVGTALVNPGVAGNYGFASAISGDGLAAIVTAYSSTSNRGSAYVFRYSGGSWDAGTALTSPYGTTAVQFGYGCAINYDGTVAVTSTGNTNPGLAGIFRYSGGVWSTMTSLNPLPTLVFGAKWSSISISSSGNSILFGSSTGGFAISTEGAATVSTAGPGTTWVVGPALAGATTGSTFGQAVALSRNGALAVVGAGGYNSGIGAAYIIPVAGVGAGPATLAVSGNVAVSNAIGTTNLSMTTANVTTLNTLSISSLVGINTSAPSGTSLYVRGNVVTTKDLSLVAVQAGTINATSTNILSVYGTSGFVGFGTSAPSGTSLYVAGNVYTSGTLNVATSVAGIAATTVNVLSISSYGPYINQAAFLDPTAWAQVPFSASSLADAAGKGNLTSPTGTGTLTYTAAGGPSGKPSLVVAAASGPSWTVATNAINIDVTGASMAVWVKFNASIVSSTQALWTLRTTNTAFSWAALKLAADASSGIYFSPSSGSTLNAYWNQTWVINQWYHIVSILDPNTKTTSVYINGSLRATSATSWTTAGYITTSFDLSGPSSRVAQQTEFADVRIYDRALTASEISTIYNSTAGAPGFQVQGNVAASNALVTTNVTAATINTTRTNTLSIYGTSGFVGVGTAAPSGTSLYVQGNIYASNTLTSPNIVPTTINTAIINTISIYGKSGFVAFNSGTPSGTSLYVQGNIYASNTISTPLLLADGINAINSNTLSIYGRAGLVAVNATSASGTSLYVSGNIYASNAISANNLLSNAINVINSNTLSIYGRAGLVAVNATSASGTSLYVAGNVYVSNALSPPTVRATTINTTNSNTLTIYGTSGFVAVNATSASGTSLYVAGNVYVSNALSPPTVRATTINTTNSNTLTIYGTSGFVGLGTTAPSGTSLYVAGNVYTSANLNAATSVGTIAATTVNVLSISSYGPYINQVGFLDPTAWAQVPFSGSSLADVKGRLTSPTGTGSLTYTPNGGPSGVGAVSMTTGSYASWTVPSNAINIDATGISVSMWFRFDATMDVNGYQALWRMGISHGNLQDFSLVFRPGQQFSLFYPVSGETLIAYLTRSWSTAQWYHATSVLDPVTKKQSIYVNGSLIQTGSTTWTTAGYAATIFQIGNSGLNEYLDQPTSFADVRVYDRALTAGEISAIYNLGNSGAPGFQVSGNTAVTGTIGYGEDLTKRSIHLRPSVANAAAIQGWISATCNAADQPTGSYWATSRAPLYANVVAGTTSGYSGGVLVPDGRVALIPNGIFNPVNSTLSQFSGTGVASGSFSGGVLMPNGNVLYVPQTSNIGMFDPTTGRYSNAVSVPAGGYSGVLSSNGVVLTPTGAPSNVLIYQSAAATVSNVLAIASNPAPAQVWTTASTVVGTKWYSVEWSPQLGLFTACGTQTPYLAYSTDGRNWTAATTVAGGSLWRTITWSPELGLFITAGSFSGPYLAYSSDGKNWTGATTAVGTFWYSSAWSPQLGLFVVAGDASPYLAYSTDGKNWTAATSLVGTNWYGVSWSPQLGLFVAVGTATPYMAYSTDGKNWIAATTAIASPGWNGTAWSPELGLFVAVGYAAPNILAYSTDGKNWTIAASSVGSQWWGVDWSPQLGVFVATGFATPYLAYSTNGKNWTAATTTLGTSWYGVAWSPQLGIFVIGGTQSPYLAYTANIAPIKSGSLLLPSGNVAFSPPGTSNITQFNPVTLSQSNITIGTDGYAGLVLAPNGNVITVPTTQNVVSISTTALTASNVGPVTGGGANVSSWFQGGGLLPSGNVMFTPGFSANVGLFDPAARTFSNSTQVGSNTIIKFSGSTLLPNGQVVMVPSGAANVGLLDTMTPAPPEFCLSPYVNKF